MKKVIGIYCGNKWFKNWDENTVRNEGAGGSETWAVELSSVFQRWGFHVIVFGQPKEHHFAEDGVEYVPWQDFEKRCEYQHFDYFISSRVTYEITPWIDCNNIYLMGHDTEIELRYDTEVLKLDRVKKIFLLSNWQKNIYLANYNGLSEERVVLTCNGVDQSLYQNVDINSKENLMVWSSCPERGIFTIINKIYPEIKKEIPDFKIKICSYGIDNADYSNIDGVEFVGKLSKKELAELQKRAKIWIYPNKGTNDNGELFHETFCITAVENALAQNAIVCFNAGGITSTLKDYNYMFGREFFNELDFKYVNLNDDDMLSLLIDNSILLLKNEEKRRAAANAAYSICRKYTWEKCAKDWLKEWGLIYE